MQVSFLTLVQLTGLMVCCGWWVEGGGELVGWGREAIGWWVEEVWVVEEKPILEEEQKKLKTVELVKCEKCDKELTKRTLRYDHEKTCPGEPIVREALPVKRRGVSKKETEKQTEPVNIPNELIEQEVKKRMQLTARDRIQQKMKLRDERIKRLTTQIA